MTREEAIKMLGRLLLYCDPTECPHFDDCNKCAEAYSMAIEALEQEPNEDLISRQDAIDALMKSSVYAWSTEEDQIAHEWVLNIISKLSAKE